MHTVFNQTNKSKGNFVEATLRRRMDLPLLPTQHPFNPDTFLLLSPHTSPPTSLLFSLSFSSLFPLSLSHNNNYLHFQ